MSINFLSILIDSTLEGNELQLVINTVVYFEELADYESVP